MQGNVAFQESLYVNKKNGSVQNLTVKGTHQKMRKLMKRLMRTLEEEVVASKCSEPSVIYYGHHRNVIISYVI